MKAARGAWNGNSYRSIPGDKDDPYVQLVLRGVAADHDPDGDSDGTSIVVDKPS